MLSKTMYTENYIQNLSQCTGCDRSLLERVIYAFGLLEAIQSVGLPFCFKGGTSLMLLLEHPMRLSTDIDIIVGPDTDIEPYIRQAGKIFPFTDVEEHHRPSRGNIKKRHFKFRYQSPMGGHDVTILLDVLFERLKYRSTQWRPIENDLLLSEGESLTVRVPSVNCILGDKLTAFAPHTTGVPFGVNKELEIIKQLFDCGTLFDYITDYKEVRDTYLEIARMEMDYRGLDISIEDILKDTVKGCLCIASRGTIYKEDYAYFKDGISRIRNHIMGCRLTGETAGIYAGKVLYLAASILSRQEELPPVQDIVSGSLPATINTKMFSYLRIVDKTAYGYLLEGIYLLQGHF